MKFISIICVLMLTISACSIPTELGNNKLERKNAYDALIVYETARATDLRLSKVGEYAFKDKRQALEWEKSIFVNPNKLLSNQD